MTKKIVQMFCFAVLIAGGFFIFTGTASAVAPAVGDTYKGGKVAYILQSGDPGYVEGETHGLIAAPSDLADAPWGCNGTTISGADGTALGTGNQNTIDIMAGCSTPGIAARLAGDLVLNGYSDWYLPSKDELNKLYLNQVAIGGFDNPPYFDYWTSTEQSSSDAWGQYFANSNQYGNGKSLTYLHVRAIRSFSDNVNVPLGSAGSFAVLGGSGITNTGVTTITGDVGTHPTATETGFGPGANSVTITGTNHVDDATTQTAKTDLATAYNNAAGQVPDANLSGQDLGGMTLGHGVYKFNTSAQLTGTLTLDGGGDSNAVFIFQIGSTLTTASSSHVNLINGAQAKNVFWQVGSSATLGTYSNFKGSILALTSITDDGYSTIHGRLLAINALVTLNNTTITTQNHAPGSITIESAKFSMSNTGHTNGDMDSNGYANIGDHIVIWLTVSNTDGGCNSTGTVAYANLLKYGGGASSSLICYTDNGGIHDLLATELVIANAGTDGIDVGVNSGSSVTLSVSDADDSTTTTTNNLGDGVDDTFTTLGVDTTAPVITNVTATQHDATYKAGDTIDITVSFSENVYADWAAQPTLTLNSSATPLHMAGGNGSSDWTFEYVVGAGNSSSLLDYVNTSSFALGATTIKGNHGGLNFNDAILDLPALGGGHSLSQQNIVIDSVAPTITSVTSSATPDTYGPGSTIDFTLNFSETSSSVGGLAVTLNNGAVVNIPPFSGKSDVSATYEVGVTGSGQDTSALDVSSVSGAIIDNANNVNSSLTIPGGQNIYNTTGTFVIDTTSPPISQIKAMLQSSADPVHVTNNWYYYGLDEIRFKVTTNEPLSMIRACIRSITHEDPMNFCDPYGANYFLTGVLGDDYINPVGSVGNTYEFDQPLAGLSHVPTTPGGYAMALYLVDTSGNVTISNSQSNSFGAVFGINPHDMTAELNNATTTDWSIIDDFTSVSPLVFSAQTGGEELGRITLNGPLNLTDQATIDALINLGDNMTVSGDRVRIDSSALAAFNGGADLLMHVNSGGEQPGVVVKNNTGVVQGYVPSDQSGDVADPIGGDDLTGFSWDGVNGDLTFSTSGFSEFDTDFTAPTATVFLPATGATNVSTTTALRITFSKPIDPTSFTYTLSPDPGGLGVNWNHNGDEVSFSNNSLAKGTSYTLTITTAKDMVGNNLTGDNSTTFTTVAVASPTHGSSGSYSAPRLVIPPNVIPPLTLCPNGMTLASNCTIAPSQTNITTTTTTTTSNGTCATYLTKYIKLGAKNDPVEVKKLQKFLKDYEGFSTLKVDGVYGSISFNAVKKFQIKYTKDILTPWNLVNPTGIVSKTTIKKINELYCKNIKQ